MIGAPNAGTFSPLPTASEAVMRGVTQNQLAEHMARSVVVYRIRRDRRFHTVRVWLPRQCGMLAGEHHDLSEPVVLSRKNERQPWSCAR